MAKSMRCKREKRLRAIKRDLVQPFYDKKEEAKLAALEAALSAPKLPVKPSPFASSSSSSSSASAMDVNILSNTNMDVEMVEGGGKAKELLKPVGKKLKKKLKLARNKRRGKGKGNFKRRHI